MTLERQSYIESCNYLLVILTAISSSSLSAVVKHKWTPHVNNKWLSTSILLYTYYCRNTAQHLPCIGCLGCCICGSCTICKVWAHGSVHYSMYTCMQTHILDTAILLKTKILMPTMTITISAMIMGTRTATPTTTPACMSIWTCCTAQVIQTPKEQWQRHCKCKVVQWEWCPITASCRSRKHNGAAKGKVQIGKTWSFFPNTMYRQGQQL